MDGTRRAFAAFFILLFASAAAAQTASLSGRVADDQGGVVVNASVILSGPSGARPRTTRTGAEGSFVFDNVAPGRYVIHIDAPGFVTWSQDVTVSAGMQPLAVTLKVGGIIEDVQVSGTAPYTLSKAAPTASRLGLSPL